MAVQSGSRSPTAFLIVGVGHVRPLENWPPLTIEHGLNKGGQTKRRLVNTRVVVLQLLRLGKLGSAIAGQIVNRVQAAL